MGPLLREAVKISGSTPQRRCKHARGSCLRAELVPRRLQRFQDVSSSPAAEDYAKLETAVEALGYLQELVADQAMTMAELRRLVVVQPGTELQSVLRQAGLEPPAARDAEPTPSAVPRSPVPGHGRHGASVVSTNY